MIKKLLEDRFEYNSIIEIAFSANHFAIKLFCLYFFVSDHFILTQ